MLIGHLPHPSHNYSVENMYSHLPPVKNSHFFLFFCGEFTYFLVLFCKCLKSIQSFKCTLLRFGSIRSDENCTSEEQENITKSYCTFHHFPPFLRRKVDHCKLYRTNQSLRSLHCWSSALCYLLTIPFPKVRSVGISCLFSCYITPGRGQAQSQCHIGQMWSSTEDIRR